MRRKEEGEKAERWVTGCIGCCAKECEEEGKMGEEDNVRIEQKGKEKKRREQGKRRW